MLICKFDIDICEQIIDSWLFSMDVKGYMPREQARGDELISMIPSGFVDQDAFEGNPPTMLFSILSLPIEMQKKYFPKLLTWY